MPLHNSMSTDELLAVGFVITPENPAVASHKKHKAWRYKCEKCGKWNKEQGEAECAACQQLAKLERGK